MEKPPLVNHETWWPSRKIGLSLAAGTPLAGLITALLQLAGIDPATPLAAALGALIAAAVGYVMREREPSGWQ